MPMVQVWPVWVAMSHLFMTVFVSMATRYCFQVFMPMMAIIVPMNMLMLLLLIFVSMFVLVFVTEHEK